jgi:5-methyltetrahydrofolate--homocysteine methyltransferase
MSTTIELLSKCVEFGKINKNSPYPPSMRGQDGADEYTRLALEEGVLPGEILDALIPAMTNVGVKFSQNKIFIPEMLMAAKAMSESMKHLKPFFISGDVQRKGTFIIGTVFGDLHDIGKNLVGMMIEGAGWEVIDLGSDVKTELFLQEVAKYPGCVVGLSALLTTTMIHMETIVKAIKQQSPETKVIIGGAPLSLDYSQSIGADFYARDPQGAVVYLEKLVA